MSILYEEIGGCRIGSLNYTIPFAKIAFDKESITIRYPNKNKIVFYKNNVASIDIYNGFTSKGLQIRHNLFGVEQRIVFWSSDINRLFRKLLVNDWLQIKSEDIESYMLEDFLTPPQKISYRYSSINKSYISALFICLICVPVGILFLYGICENLKVFSNVNVLRNLLLACLIGSAVLCSANIIIVNKRKNSLFSLISSWLVCFLVPICTFFLCSAVSNLIALMKANNNCNNKVIKKFEKLKRISFFYGGLGILSSLFVLLGWGYIFREHIEYIKSYHPIAVIAICILPFMFSLVFPVGFICSSFRISKQKDYYFAIFMTSVLALLTPVGTLAAILIFRALFDEDVKRLFYKKESD